MNRLRSTSGDPPEGEPISDMRIFNEGDAERINRRIKQWVKANPAGEGNPSAPPTWNSSGES